MVEVLEPMVDNKVPVVLMVDRIDKVSVVLMFVGKTDMVEVDSFGPILV